MFLRNLALSKPIKSKGNFADNNFYNILGLFDVLPIFLSNSYETIA